MSVVVCTIGFTKKSAEEFFVALKQAGIRRVVDVRLHNTSQLAGFTKREDLPFFLREICGAEYLHLPILAPSPDLFDAYRKRKGGWPDYERGFFELMAQRRVEKQVDPAFFAVPTVLLCTEPTADHCHRRLLLEYLQSRGFDLAALHL